MTHLKSAVCCVATALLVATFAPRVAAQRILFVADRDYPPMNYLEEGAPKGLCVDIIKALSKQAGKDMPVQLMAWDKAQAMVQDGSADALGLMAVTPERQAKYEFTDAVMSFEYSLLVKSSESQIQGAKDLPGRAVGVTPGGYPRQALGDRGIRLVLVSNYQDGIQELLRGNIDALAADKWVALYYLSQQKSASVKLISPPFAVRDAAFAVRKGNVKLRDEINISLWKLKGQGTIDEIEQNWFGKQVVFMTWESARTIVATVSAIVGVVLLAMLSLWIYTLRRQIAQRKVVEMDVRKLNMELEQRVVERTVQLALANQDLEAFTYSVSHDLRAPLRTIDGLSKALVEDHGSEIGGEAREYLDRIVATAADSRRLIEDMLSLSRISQAEMSLETVDLSAIAQRIADELSANEPARVATFHITPGLIAQGDRGFLTIALNNLIGNAWKFTSKRKEAMIEFGVKEQDGTPVYYVRDNGNGFDMKHADALFEAFRRLHTDDEFPGTGVGLATVRRIINRHRGKVWAEGKVGEGATFSFTIQAPTPGSDKL